MHDFRGPDVFILNTITSQVRSAVDALLASGVTSDQVAKQLGLNTSAIKR